MGSDELPTAARVVPACRYAQSRLFRHEREKHLLSMRSHDREIDSIARSARPRRPREERSFADHRSGRRRSCTRRSQRAARGGRSHGRSLAMQCGRVPDRCAGSSGLRMQLLRPREGQGVRDGQRHREPAFEEISSVAAVGDRRSEDDRVTQGLGRTTMAAPAKATKTITAAITRLHEKCDCRLGSCKSVVSSAAADSFRQPKSSARRVGRGEEAAVSARGLGSCSRARRPNSGGETSTSSGLIGSEEYSLAWPKAGGTLR